MKTAIALSLLAFRVLHAAPAPASARFEVVSIKPSAPDAHGSPIQAQPGGGLRATNVTLKMFLAYAYNVRDFQISGGPAWINCERYDITAKPEQSPSSNSSLGDPVTLTEAQGKTDNEQMGERVQSMLADRFHLILHRETKEETTYALVVAKGGSKLKAAKEGGGPTMSMGRGQITAERAPIRMLTGPLGNILGRPVVDKTDLQGKYDFQLEWAPESSQGELAATSTPATPPPNGPSIFTALQEQLGVRIERQRSPVDILVIDRVEKPTEN